MFTREAKPYINVNAVKAYFSASKKNNSCSFRVSDMMEVLDFILDNIFVKCGRDIFIQVMLFVYSYKLVFTSIPVVVGCSKTNF